MKRRKFLESTGIATVVSTSGCIGPSSNSSENDEPFSHPSTTDLNSQPFIGPSPSVEKPVIIAFEDLACPLCRSFHQNTFNELKQEYISNNDLTFVFRGTDFAGYPWSGTAALVQEAVYEQETEKTFDVIEQYYNNQERFNSSNIIEESRSMLENMDVNADSVINSVQNGEVSDNFQSDKSAGINANIRGTPSFVLLENGLYKTTVVGPKNISVFESVLSL